jgi:hypothetical protein
LWYGRCQHDPTCRRPPIVTVTLQKKPQHRKRSFR